MRKILSSKELRALVPYCLWWIYTLEKRGQFPHRIKLGPNKVGWWEDEVEAWAKARQAETEAARNPKS
jgi:predicted DNA-binding transcriptional regulator AlpA